MMKQLVKIFILTILFCRHLYDHLFICAGYRTIEERRGSVDQKVTMEVFPFRIWPIQSCMVFPFHPASVGWQETRCIFVRRLTLIAYLRLRALYYYAS